VAGGGSAPAGSGLSPFSDFGLRPSFGFRFSAFGFPIRSAQTRTRGRVPRATNLIALPSRLEKHCVSAASLPSMCGKGPSI
jgi:hypothetical protein